MFYFSKGSLGCRLRIDCQDFFRLTMEPGDVLFVDNYRALHGRDVWFIVVYMLDRRMGDRTRRQMERCNGELCSRRK